MPTKNFIVTVNAKQKRRDELRSQVAIIPASSAAEAVRLAAAAYPGKFGEDRGEHYNKPMARPVVPYDVYEL